ncbi:MAG: PAS domain-containing protein [Alphaproteobacteria bacterium]|nr:PAS domain-containing protein [Alphaproteobacteria bacterium]
MIGEKVVTFMTEESARHAIDSAHPEFVKTGRTTDLPLKFVKKNGEVIDVLLSSVAERDEGGKFVRSLTVLTDVTERKRAEERFPRYFDLPLVGSATTPPTSGGSRSTTHFAISSATPERS